MSFKKVTQHEIDSFANIPLDPVILQTLERIIEPNMSEDFYRGVMTGILGYDFTMAKVGELLGKLTLSQVLSILSHRIKDMELTRIANSN